MLKKQDIELQFYVLVLMTQEKRDKLLKTIEEYEAGTEGYEKKLLKLKVIFEGSPFRTLV